MFCKVEQVVGESDRFRANRNFVRHNVYPLCGTTSFYSSGSIDLCKKSPKSNKDEIQAVICHTNTPGMTMHESNTHKQVQWELAYASKQTLCCSELGAHFSPNGCPSTSTVLKRQYFFFFHSICISFSSRGGSITALSGSISCSVFWTGCPLT